MSRTTKRFLIAGVFVFASLVNMAAQVRPDRMDQGGQWLSWSQEKKVTFVAGFLDGYLSGTYHLCDGADKLFKVKDPRRVSSQAMPGSEASVLCLATRNDYSKQYSSSGMDFSPYADIITEFYTKHPDYAAVPFPELMLFLGDGKCDSADQLYQLALKGELHRVVDRSSK
jgi:hypothetical protein